MNNIITNKEKREKKTGNIFVAVFAIVVVVFIMCTFFAMASRNGDEDFTTSAITISSGDTLSSIAVAYCNEKPVDEAVSDIMRINNMSSTSICAGQELLIPIYN